MQVLKKRSTFHNSFYYYLQVKDFEKRECCRNLKLQHFMLKPVQRLPQYKLLLEDYLRRINHDSVDFDDTTIALRIVSDAADHANNTIRQGVRTKPLLKIGTANAICWNSLGLFRDYGLNCIIFRNETFLFFKVESRNFQYLFEKEIIS